MDPVKPYPVIKWIAIVIIVFNYQTNVHYVQGNPEVPSNSLTCYKTVSCRGKCSNKVQWDSGTTQIAPHCHCDPSCTKYKDCCLDFTTFCGNQTARSPIDQEFACRRINDREPRIWMIESCPRSFKDKTVREKCYSTQQLRADIIMDQLPVYSIFNNLRYKNRYCGLCNGAMDMFLFYFDMRIKCNLRPPSGLNSTQTLTYMLEHCSAVQFQLPKGTNRRHCYPTVDSCPKGSSMEARKQCLESLPAVVFDAEKKDKNYVNIQCMACHSSVSATRKAVCGPQPVKEDIFDPKSFEVVMNFDNKAGGLTIEKKVDITCGEGYSYDEHLEMCREVITGPSLGLTDKYRSKMWLSPLDGRKPENFSRSEFIQVLTAQFSPLDAQQVDIISLEVEDRSTIVLFDLHATYHSVDAKRNESNSTMDLKALLDFKESFTMVVAKRTWNVFKVTTRRLSCTKSEVYPPGQFSIFLHNETAIVESNGVLDYLSLKQYYLVREDKNMRHNESSLVVCRSFFGILCNHSLLAAEESEYTVFQNKSLLFKPTGQWFNEGDYDMRGKTPWICTKYKFKKQDGTNGTNGNITITYEPNIHVEVRRYLTIIGFSISVFSLFLVLLTHGILRDLRTPLPGKNLMSLSLSLFLAHFWFLLGSGDTDKPLFCKITGHILHYFFLVSFGCTFIVAYDTRRTFSVKTIKAHAIGGSFQAKRLAAYLFISWGIPFVFVSTCATLDWLDVVAIGYGSGGACWIGNGTASLVVFATPIGLVLVYNVMAFSQTVYAINKAKQQTQRVKSNHYTRPATVKIYMRLVSLMGFSWFFGISAPLIHHGLMYPFVFFTTLQGLYIFLAFVFKTKVLRMIKAKLPLKKRNPVRRPIVQGTISTMANSMAPYNKYTTSCKDETQI